MTFLDYPVDLGFWEQGIDVGKIADKLYSDAIKRHTSFENAQKRRLDKKLAQARRLQTEYGKQKKRLENAKDREEKQAAKIAFDQTKLAVQTILDELESPEEYVNNLFKKETLPKDVKKLKQSITNQETYIGNDANENHRNRLKEELTTTAKTIVKELLAKTQITQEEAQ